MRRFLLAVLLVATGCAVLALPAAAFPPGARTDFPTEVTDSGATLNGIAYDSSGGSGVTYHFEYGATSSYGNQTPEAQAPPFTPPEPSAASQRVDLPGGTTFHFRIVATNTLGEKGLGQDVEWKTPGAPPPGPGTTRKSDTVGAGGSLSTGSDPSKSNPIVVSVKAEQGGKLIVDEIANPDRPGAVSCDDEPNNPDCVEANPEDTGPKDKHWYGPAIRIFAPEHAASDDPDATPRQVITIVFRIDGDTDLMDSAEAQHLLTYRVGGNPEIQGSGAACLAGSNQWPKRRTLAGGDTELTFTYKCKGGDPMTFQFYNPGWGVRTGEFFGSFDSDLKSVLDRGKMSFGLHCTLVCLRTITATIAKKSAKKLGLKSNVIGTLHTDRGEDYDRQVPLNGKARKALRKIARTGGKITVSFQAKAVGPDGQVFKKGNSTTLKAESTDDEF